MFKILMKEVDPMAKKTRLHKFISLLLTIILLFSFCLFAASANAMDSSTAALVEFESNLPNEIKASMEQQADALDLYQNLFDALPKDDVGLPIAPHEYAGCYIDDTGHLVIQLTTITDDLKNTYYDFCGTAASNNTIIFKKVAHSINELAEFKTLASENKDMTGYSTRIKDNSFEISIDPDSSTPYGPPTTMIAIAAGEPINISYSDAPNSSATLYGGSRITNETHGYGFSICISGTFNGQDAILTCGHGNERDSSLIRQFPYIKYGSSRIGQVVHQRANMLYPNSGQDTVGEFAIVRVDSGTLTNRLNNSISITGTYSSPPEGTTIYKYGSTTGYSAGTVVYECIYSFTELTLRIADWGDGNVSTSKYYIYGLTRSSMQGANSVSYGDSGGPVYLKSGSNYLLHGSVVGFQQNSTGVSCTMYSSGVYYAQNVGFTVKTN